MPCHAMQWHSCRSQDRQPGVEFDMATKPIFIRDSYKGSGKLQDKVAIITGEGRGLLGRAFEDVLRALGSWETDRTGRH